MEPKSHVQLFFLKVFSTKLSIRFLPDDLEEICVFNYYILKLRMNGFVMHSGQLALNDVEDCEVNEFISYSFHNGLFIQLTSSAHNYTITYFRLLHDSYSFIIAEMWICTYK